VKGIRVAQDIVQ